MERREDIRAAMQSLLSPASRPEAVNRHASTPERDAALHTRHFTALSERQLCVLREIQSNLRDNGIKAEIPEIVQAMVEALTVRPALCRGLLAAYLTEG